MGAEYEVTSCFSSHILCVAFSCLCARPHVPVRASCVGMYSMKSVHLVRVWMHVCECEESAEGHRTESTAFRKVPQ